MRLGRKQRVDGRQPMQAELEMQKAFRQKSRSTPEAFEALLDEIYAAGEDPRHWEAVLAALADQLSGNGGGLHAGTMDGSGFSFGATYRVDPVCLAEYAQYYYSVNPLNAALARVPVGVAAPDHRLVAPRDMERTEFHNAHSRRFDHAGSITLVLARDGGEEACLAILRRYRSDVFSDEQVAFVQRLAPHIRRAIGLNRRLAGMQNERATLETALGSIETAVLVVDRAGVIRYGNAAGETLLEKRDGLKVSQGRLYADDLSAQNILAGLMRAALAEKGARGGSVPVPRRYSPRPLLVKIMPIAQSSEFWLNSAQPCAILFISDPEPLAGEVADEVMGAYGLTPSERRLLSELIAGRSLREAADSLNITRATSRNRLARIMAKTDTHRQSELIQLILRSSVPVR